MSNTRERDRRTTAALIERALADLDRDDDTPATYRALVTLQARGTRDVLDAAVALCRSADPKRRSLGARILGELGSPERSFPEECCDALLDLVRRDPDVEVRGTAVFALGHLRNRRCEPDLVALRNSPDERIRHGVASALSGTTSSASIHALLELMEDPYVLARDWATTGVGWATFADGPEIRASLLRRADDDDEMVRAEALHGLSRRHDERVVPFLIAELSAGRQLAELFAAAAKTYLGINEESDVEAATLVSMLARPAGVPYPRSRGEGGA